VLTTANKAGTAAAPATAVPTSTPTSSPQPWSPEEYVVDMLSGQPRGSYYEGANGERVAPPDWSQRTIDGVPLTQMVSGGQLHLPKGMTPQRMQSLMMAQIMDPNAKNWTSMPQKSAAYVVGQQDAFAKLGLAIPGHAALAEATPGLKAMHPLKPNGMVQQMKQMDMSVAKQMPGAAAALPKKFTA